jgi:hypothetical protein
MPGLVILQAYDKYLNDPLPARQVVVPFDLGSGSLTWVDNQARLATQPHLPNGADYHKKPADPHERPTVPCHLGQRMPLARRARPSRHWITGVLKVLNYVDVPNTKGCKGLVSRTSGLLLKRHTCDDSQLG